MVTADLLQSRINHAYCEEFIKRDLPRDVPPKALMILGHGRSGKDTAADYLKLCHRYEFSGTSSKILCKYIYPEGPEHLYVIRHTYKQQLFDFGNVIRDVEPRFIPWMSLQGGSQLLVGLRAKLDIAAALKTCVHGVVWMNSAVPVDPTMDYDLQWLVDACSRYGNVPLYMLNNIKDTTANKGLLYLYSQIDMLEDFRKKL